MLQQMKISKEREKDIKDKESGTVKLTMSLFL